jgi:superfamily II DNA or RNA helicase
VDELCSKLYSNIELSAQENEKVLGLSVLFLNYGDYFAKRYGYSVLLRYCNKYQDNVPLYEVAAQLGYFPIVSFIETQENQQGTSSGENFSTLTFSAWLKNFKYNNVVMTLEQAEMEESFRKNINKTFAVVAPTSYGKSELISKSLSQHRDCNVCIVVPTKSLLAQTRHRVISSFDATERRKVITHPEMYQNSDRNFVAVLTQERLLRILKKNSDLQFSLVFIDEAHNLFEKGDRAKLLSSVIAMLYRRNPQTSFKFLSPFLIDIENLRVLHAGYAVEKHIVKENIKSERYFLCDLKHGDGKLKRYDPFFNKCRDIAANTYTSPISVVRANKGKKNVVYFNRPRNLESFSKELSSGNSLVNSDRLNVACDNLKEYLHAEYNLIDCLRHGVAYHHGSVPDNVRLYIEELFSSTAELSYLATTSTLLEGVNIPADKLFMLEQKKGRGNLSASQLKNLAGRVCRFKEIFDARTGTLALLEPEIYIINSEEYSDKRLKLEKFISERLRIDKKIKDKLENVLLRNTEMTEKKRLERKQAEELLENIEPGTVAEYNQRIARSSIGRSSFANGITEIDILDKEDLLEASVQEALRAGRVAQTPKDVMGLLQDIFFCNIREEQDDLKRMQQGEARDFYAMFLDWRIDGKSYKEMISRTLGYWERRCREKNGEVDIFVGRWGDKKRGGPLPLWVDIRQKGPRERVNLAVVRIKEEQDFLDNRLMKFIEVLFESELVATDLYHRIKYGTSDENAIVLIKNGFSFALALLVLEKYRNSVEIDLASNTVIVKASLIDEMGENLENEILINEMRLNIA